MTASCDSSCYFSGLQACCKRTSWCGEPAYFERIAQWLNWGRMRTGSFLRGAVESRHRGASHRPTPSRFDVERLPDLPYAAVLSELAVLDKNQQIATPDEVLFSGVKVQNV